MKLDIAYYMAAVPDLVNRYQQATASMAMPDNDTAEKLLIDIRNRVEQALAIIQDVPPERLAYRTALDVMIMFAGNNSYDPVQIAHEAITPYTDWKVVSAADAFAIDRAAEVIP